MGSCYAFVCDARREWIDGDKRPDLFLGAAVVLWMVYGAWRGHSMRLVCEGAGDEFYRIHPGTRDCEVEAWGGKPGDQYKDVTDAVRRLNDEFNNEGKHG